jgi:Spy/CpxP family protein refolding chaperone
MKSIAGVCLAACLSIILPVGIGLAQEEEEHLEVPEVETAPQPGMCRAHQMHCGMKGGTMGDRMMGMRECGKHGRIDDSVVGILHRFGGPGLGEIHADELGLAAEQVAKIRDIWSAHKKAAVHKKADLKIAHLELAEILGQDPIDFGKAKSKIEQIGSMRQQAGLDMLDTVTKAHGVLTDEQAEKLISLRRHSCCGAMKHDKMKKCAKM